MFAVLFRDDDRTADVTVLAQVLAEVCQRGPQWAVGAMMSVRSSDTGDHQIARYGTEAEAQAAMSRFREAGFQVSVAVLDAAGQPVELPAAGPAPKS